MNILEEGKRTHGRAKLKQKNPQILWYSFLHEMGLNFPPL